MNKNKLSGLWVNTAQNRPELNCLCGEIKTDTAIIGGGYTGMSAALHLAEAGADTAVLEAEEIGFGGAGRNVGLVNAGLWILPDEIIKKLGKDFGRRLNTVLGASPDLVFSLIKKHQINCEALRNGTLQCAHSRAGYCYLKKRKDQWKAFGADLEVLDSEEAGLKIGTKAFYGALLDKRAGTIQPLSYLYGLCNAAVKAGARVYADSPAVNITRNKNNWEIKTPSGIIKTKAVILAANGYCKFGFKHFQKNFIPFNFFQFSTKPIKKEIRRSILPEGHGAWDTNLILSSFRLDKAGRLIVGSVGNVDGLGYTVHKNWALQTINKIFPQIKKIEFEHGWFGTIAMTNNHIPQFHILGPDFITITNYNGRGIGPGTLFGKLAGQFILDGNKDNIPLPISKQSPVFLRNLRGLFYETGARMYHLIQRRLNI